MKDVDFPAADAVDAVEAVESLLTSQVFFHPDPLPSDGTVGLEQENEKERNTEKKKESFSGYTEVTVLTRNNHRETLRDTRRETHRHTHRDTHGTQYSKGKVEWTPSHCEEQKVKKIIEKLFSNELIDKIAINAHDIVVLRNFLVSRVVPPPIPLLLDVPRDGSHRKWKKK